MQSLSLIGWGIIKNILMYASIAIAAVGIFYLVKYIQKASKKQKAYVTKAIILDLNGVIEFDMLAFVKSEDTGLLEMEFKERKTDSIPPIPKHLIKNNNVILLNYAPGHYAVLDTSETMHFYNNGKWEAVPYNLGMKKYIMAKQREIMNKAETKIKKWETYAPWIVLGSAIGCAILLAFFLFYFGIKFDEHNIAVRMAECKEAFRIG